MRIDRALNIVIPVDLDDDVTVYVHSTPVSEDLFEKYFLTISKTFSQLAAEGAAYLFSSGPRVAGLMLKKVAMDDGVWAGVGGIESGLVAEIRRLTNVVLPGSAMPAEAARARGGWATLPFEDVLNRNILSKRDASDVEGAITFFIVASFMLKRGAMEQIKDGLAQFWGARFEQSNCTEFAASLQISTETDNSGVTVTISSGASSPGQLMRAGS